MADFALLLFGVVTLIALVLSTWVPSYAELEGSFWALTALVLGLPLVIAAVLAVFDIGEYAAFRFLLFVWIPIAAGWLLGLLLSLVVRFFRARAS